MIPLPNNKKNDKLAARKEAIARRRNSFANKKASPDSFKPNPKPVKAQTMGGY